MEGLREFLEHIQHQTRIKGHLLGLLHIVIGRKISKADGTVVSSGATWREVSNLLRVVRWDPDAVKELGIDPESLPPRDRQRYWYSAIAQAQVSSDAAIRDADKLGQLLQKSGYVIGSAPGR